jgi:hypothetical protein
MIIIYYYITFLAYVLVQEKKNWMRDLQQCIDDHIARHPEDKGSVLTHFANFEHVI